jgi:riboflavin synthase
MASAVLDQWERMGARVEPVRYTVPGFKDLPVACKILFEERKCQAVIALGMAGGAPIDELCAHEASQGLQQVQLATNKHIIECFVHTPEARDESDLAALMESRAREHAENVYFLLAEPERLQRGAGTGLRQGRADEGSVAVGRRAKRRPVRLAIVWSRFNGAITRAMLSEARAEAAKRGALVIREIAVAGAFDIPTAAREVLRWTDADAVVTLGAVIKGDTQHDELVAHRAAEALLAVSAEFSKPVALGITGPGMTWKQAKDRIPNARYTVRAALEQVEALRRARAALEKP